MEKRYFALVLRKSFFNVKPPKVNECILRVHVCKCVRVCLIKKKKKRKKKTLSDVNIAI